ncbi:MAG TPA: ribbon-helix-helix protein, CopG family [Candidatus Saccharimonadales bacterium]|nr:ribbon-helix-helix protein, CopG family [Candidatus Saccharimonadales bacterium]
MKAQTFNVSMPKRLVERIDAQTRRQGSTRSDFIRQAVNKQLSILESWEKLTTNTRQEYKGKKLSEDEVADIVRDERSK